MRIAVVGTGYVGLVTGACFAEVGNHVTCLDIDQVKIAQLQQGKLPFFEPGLEEKVLQNRQAGRLKFTTDPKEAMKEVDCLFLAVPTPPKEDGSADLSYLEKAVHTLRPLIPENALVVLKSTAPVGTTRSLAKLLSPLAVVCNPEFLKQGNAVADFCRPDRILIGADCLIAANRLKDLYAPFSMNHNRILTMDPESAEMAKYASNAMLATRISFMNDLSRLCESTGADVTKVRLAMGADQRIGYHFLYAGAGYGGSCFPKDVNALRAMALAYGFDMPLLKAVEEINQRQKQLLGEKIRAHFAPHGGVDGKTIGILGLAFKPDTDDMRSASSLPLIHTLVEEGATLRLYDPVAMTRAKTLLHQEPSLIWCANEEEVAQDADALVLVTEWKQFRFLDFPKLLQAMKGTAFFDGRNQYPIEEMVKFGFTYIGIGRGTSPLHLENMENSSGTATRIHR
ncbi:MAG: UDP-glucose/GDP-mannose dehydrogenase family protein [Verrucomicrobia bacterium]|nr:UDP-glucose/GDP-mannose dehydrogenase family protein [Verrucomicrobiota bacterium]